MNVKQKNIYGINLSKDDKGRNIYFDWIGKKSYLLSDNKLRSYQLYSSRYIIALSISYLFYSLIKNYWLGFGAFLLIIVIFEYNFRVKFLPKLTEINCEKPQYESFIIKAANRYTSVRLVSIILAAIVFELLLVINAYYSNYYGFILHINYMLGILVGSYALLLLIVLIYKLRQGNNKKNH